MTQLSVIVPYVNEWPQIAFTLRSIAEELDGVDFEVIAVDNLVPLVELQQKCLADRSHRRWVHAKKNYGLYGEHPDKAVLQGNHIESMANRNPWLKYVRYEEKLSHWNAKRVGVENSIGEIIVFIDAHCVPARDSLKYMFFYYYSEQERLNGSIHLPLTYHILESSKLIYKPVINLEKGELHYTFSQYRHADDPYEVAVMSTCGMMMSRKIYDEVGGWPRYLGIYGGGENFMNYALAVLGKRKWIMPGGPLHHHGEKRRYSSQGYDSCRNRLLANYLVCGKEMAWSMAKISKYRPLEKMLAEIFADEGNQRHRDLIKEATIVDIRKWVEKWTTKS